MERLLEHGHSLKIDQWYKALETLITDKRTFLDNAKGNYLKFQTVLDTLPAVTPSIVDLESRAVTIGDPEDLSLDDYCLIKDVLQQICPWRKGPFNLFGILIDSEWQSWMKWKRLIHQITDLKGRCILDIGSSNGYYMFRMAAFNPLMVLGLEPQSNFYFQYLAIQKYLNQENVFCLPVSHDHLPKMDKYFDTVFCMGVLYHQKSPVQMLKVICDSMRSGGELVIENLIIHSKKNFCLFPKDRYAKMRNIFFIPDLLVMESWLLRAGFTNIRCVDIAKTSSEEQRKTKWIQTETLEDFLDPNDPDKTVEGYPAPVRAIFIARAT